VGGDAPERYREALTLATELGMRPLAAGCHLGLGRLLARTGDRAAARETLAAARALFQDMEMGAGLAQADGVLYRLG
jgi:hypothetical protein